MRKNKKKKKQELEDAGREKPEVARNDWLFS